MTYSITTDTIFDNGKFAVLDGGIYDQYDLVICYLVDGEKEPYCKFEARHIVLGQEVYQ
jgi:hypothetical protein